MNDITTCYERGGQPEWDTNDYSRDFTYWGLDRSQPIALPLSERSQPMPGVSELARTDEEAQDPNQQRIDIGELLLAIRVAYEKMGNRNTHKGLLVTAGSIIIHLVTENQLLREGLEAAKAAVSKGSSVTLT